MLQDDTLRNTVLLVLANKQDLPNAANVAELTKAMGLSCYRPTRGNLDR
jgi:hypothetical protein